MKACERIQDAIVDLLLGTLAQDREEAVRGHVRDCRGCREYYETLRERMNAMDAFGEELDRAMTVRRDVAVAALYALPESVRPAATPAWRRVADSRIVKLAVAAAILLGILLLAEWSGLLDLPGGADEPEIVTPGRTDDAPGQPTERMQFHLAHARQLFQADDLPALAAMLTNGDPVAAEAAAQCLTEMADDGTIAALHKLAAAWTGAPAANPYAKALKLLEKKGSDPVSLSEEPETPMSQQDAAPSIDGTVPMAGDQSGDAAASQPATSPKETGSDPVSSDALPEHYMRVRVLEKATGGPLAGATVRTYINGSKQYTTDEEGEVILDFGDRKPDYMNLFARKDGYVGLAYRWDKEHPQIMPERFVFSLGKGTSIGGTVVDSAGEPVPGATVEFDYIEDPTMGAPNVDVRVKVATDAQGRWSCGEMPEEIIDLGFKVNAEGFGETRVGVPRDVSMAALRNKTARFTMQPGYTISGYVMNEAGRPVEGARIMLGTSYFTDDLRDWGKTDADGVFLFENVRPLNDWEQVTVTARGYAPTTQRIAMTQTAEPVQFTLRPGNILRGRVMNLRGEPVAGARVATGDWKGMQLVQWDTKTDGEGRFTWDDAPYDPIEIDVSKVGYMTIRNTPATPGPEEMLFVLGEPVRVRGRVTDAATGESIDEFTLTPGYKWFTRPGVHSGISWQDDFYWKKQFTGGTYEYTFDRTAEYYGIRIEADGYLPAESRRIEMNEADPVIDIALQPGEGIAGTVLHPDGSPAENVEICLYTGHLRVHNNTVEQKRYHTLTKTDSEGRFRFEPDLDVKAIVAIGPAGYGYAPVDALSSREPILLQPYGRIEGDLRIGTRPAADFELRIDYPEQIMAGASFTFTYSMTTDEQGRFVFPKVAPGKVRLYRETFEVEPGQTLALHLGGDGRPVAGRLLPPTGLPTSWGNWESSFILDQKRPQMQPEDMPVPPDLDAMSYEEATAWYAEFVKSEEGQALYKRLSEKYKTDNRRYPASVGHDGRFHVDNVPPGRYVLSGRIWTRDEFGGMSKYSSPIGRAYHEFTVPEILYEGQMDEPLDLGGIQLFPGTLAVGRLAPPFDLPGVHGGRLRLADFAGRTLLLLFYNRYQLDDSQTVQALQQLHSEFRDQPGFAMAAVLLGGGPADLLQAKFLEEQNLPWPHAAAVHYDNRAEVEYNVHDLPYAVVIGPDGTIRAHSLRGAELYAAVREALTDTAVVR